RVVERLHLAHRADPGLPEAVEPRLRIAEGEGDGGRPGLQCRLEQRLEHRQEGGDEPDGEWAVAGGADGRRLAGDPVRTLGGVDAAEGAEAPGGDRPGQAAA